jgi:N-acyl-D-amino-acid deacylase
VRTLIVGGEVVDGSGADARVADVLVIDDRIAAVEPGLSAADSDVVVEAHGRVVAPGFIDVHTHYDAQVFWDPTLSSSCHHGVTSVINGNCGFSLAPLAPEHRQIVLHMLRDLEDMPLAPLDAMVPPAIDSFAAYLDEVARRRPRANFGSFIGHSTVRIAAMGDAAYERIATADEVATMADDVQAALAAGAMGFATKTLVGARPSPSQFADATETETLLKVLGAHGRGVAMFNPGGAFDLERVYDTQAEIGRPFTWIALLAMPDGSHRERAELHHRRWEAGADVRPQVSCRPLVARFRMGMPSGFRAPLLTQLNEVSEAERLAAYADPAWRARLHPELRTITGPIDWASLQVLESTASPALVGMSIAEAAATLHADPFELLFDLAVEDHLATRLMVTYGNNDPAEVAPLLTIPGGVLGLSDAGAHPAQSCDGVLPTDLLGQWVRETGVLTLEGAVHKLTREPALMLGLADRGLVVPGGYADLVVFDPATVAPGPVRTVNDLPLGYERLLADRPCGMHHMLVNGVITRHDEAPTVANPGRILRPG